MTHTLGLSRRFTLAFALGLGLAAAAFAQPRPADLDARLDRLAQRLDLTDAQTDRLDAIAARTSDPSAADLWTVTEDVHAVLTDAQRQTLRERSARRGERGARRGRHRGVDRGRRGEARTDADRAARRAEREAMRPIRDAAREQQRALRDRLRSGALTDAEFATASRALREQTRAQMRDAASPEQRARMDARTAEREAARAARTQVLGLTVGQQTQLDARRAQRARSATRDLDVRPYLDADGRLDRRALRQAQREARSERGQRDEILTERQQELVRLHRALSGTRGHRRGGRGRR